MHPIWVFLGFAFPTVHMVEPVKPQISTSFLVLQSAAESGSAATVESLLGSMNGDMINSRNDNGMTALHSAVFYGHLSVTRVLMDSPRFTQTGARDNYGQTELHIAAYIGSAELVAYILEHPRFPTESVNARDEDNDTALSQAIIRSRNEVARIILDHPRFQDFRAVNGNGEDVFGVAARVNNAEIIKIMKSHRRYNQAIDDWYPASDIGS